MRKLSIIVVSAASAVLLGGGLLAAGPAGATTASCGNHPRCFGLLSAQALPLEIATSVPVSQVQSGTTLIGMTPAFSARGDWRVSRGAVKKFRWMPGGHPSTLCITATSDQARSRPTLQRCVSGTAGSSHQLWEALNVIGGGFRVYRNEANGLVMTLAGTASGSQLQIRSMGLGTALNKNFVKNKPF